MFVAILTKKRVVQDFREQVAQGVEDRAGCDRPGAAAHPAEGQGGEEDREAGGREIDQEMSDRKEEAGDQERPSHGGAEEAHA